MFFTVYNDGMTSVSKVLISSILLAPAVFAETLADASAMEPGSENENFQSIYRPQEDKLILSASAVVDLDAGTTTELVTQSGNTVMTAGTCVVVDAFLRDFCNANPQDINCQF